MSHPPTAQDLVRSFQDQIGAVEREWREWAKANLESGEYDSVRIALSELDALASLRHGADHQTAVVEEGPLGVEPEELPESGKGEPDPEVVPVAEEVVAAATLDAVAELPVAPEVEAPPIEAPEPPAPTKAKKSAPKLDWERRRPVFKTAVDVLTANDVPNEGARCMFIAAVCLGRGLLDAENTAAGRHHYEGELEVLKRRWKEVGGGSTFAFDRRLAVPGDAWADLHDAYTSFAWGFTITEFLELNDYVRGDVRVELLDAAAATQAHLFRLLEQHLPKVDEPRLFALKDRLLALGGALNYFLHWFKSKEAGGPGNSEVRKTAEGAATLYKTRRESIERSVTKDRSLIDLTNFLVGEFEVDTLADDLAARCAACLEAGVPFSDKRLIKVLLPFRHLIAERGEPKFRRLVEKLGAEALKLKQPLVVVDRDIAEEPDSPELAQKKADLRALLQGKTMLFLGGNKGQGRKREDLIELLGLQDLDWPDTDNSTNPGKLTPRVPHADLVCYLIRWSRHSYKQVLDDAKRQGKMIAVLRRGLGLNTVVVDLHAQLIGQRNGP